MFKITLLIFAILITLFMLINQMKRDSFSTDDSSVTDEETTEETDETGACDPNNSYFPHKNPIPFLRNSDLKDSNGSEYITYDDDYADQVNKAFELNNSFCFNEPGDDGKMYKFGYNESMDKLDTSY